ncbi:ABC transporter permease [Demequina sp. NBRC 110051]|uniref:ABC transporter permease n=1 Tax=Demequina sp. NBRC 110051 TaxID=1570340 RepID=UPI0009FC30C7|nr:ABC transporter permease [Demequina sp. NBRC 110051]
MIGVLLREQVRGQSRLLTWTAGLLAVGASLAATALIAASSQAVLDANPSYGAPEGMDRAALVTEWSDGPPADQDVTDATVASPGDIAAAIDEALEAGFPAHATQTHYLEWERVGGGARDDLPYMGDAIASYVDASSAIIEGRSPNEGEIAIAGDVAADLGLHIGDTVVATSAIGTDAKSAAPLTLEVSGLAIASSTQPFRTASVDAYLSWEDGIVLSEASAAQPAQDGGTTKALHAEVSWKDGAPGMEELASRDDAPLVPFDPRDGFRIPLEGWTGTLWIAALFASVGTVMASVAMGRVQAPSRARWIATARVLGATSRTLRNVAALEAVFMGIVSAAAGLCVGWLVNAAVLAWQRHAQPDAVLPLTPAVLPIAAAIVVAMTVLVASLTAIGPAVWASRTAPIAALKPGALATATPLATTPPARERGALRAHHVGGGPLALAVAGAVILVAVGSAWGGYLGPWIAGAGVVAFGVFGMALLATLADSTLTAIARRWARRTHPGPLTAAHDLLARSRQYATATLIYALACAALAGVLGHGVHALASAGATPGASTSSFGDMFTANDGRGWPSWGALGVIVVFLIIAAVIACAVVASTRIAAGDESAVHTALGLSPSAHRTSASLEFGLPLAIGATLGPLSGWAFVAVVSAPQGASLGAWSAATLLTFPGALLVAVCALAVAAGAAGVSGGLSRQVAPSSATPSR